MKIEFDDKYEIFVVGLSDEAWALRELTLELERLHLGAHARLLGVPDAYWDGGWCLHRDEDVWLVYHSERGRRSRVAIFTSPFDAANYFVWMSVGTYKADNAQVGKLPRNVAP